MSRGLMINFNNTNRETNTRYLDSNYADAPSLKNEYGSLNSLLKKVLVEGFNVKTTISLEHDIESKIATLQLPEGHGFIFNQVVELSGALEENFNGVFRVLEVRGNALKLQIPNESVHTVATTETTLSIKLAPLGFDLAYENIEEGVVCFKNKSLKSPGILKVIDKLPPNGYASNWAKYGRVVMGQQIDDLGEFINNNKAPFWPDNPEVEKVGNGVQGAGGVHGFAKWDYSIYPGNYDTIDTYAANGTFPTDWRIIGDDKTFYLMIRPMGKNRYSYNILGFGNFVPENPDETANICLQAKDGSTASNSTTDYNFARTRNNFGLLDMPYTGFLFSNNYGKTSLISDYGRYRCAGLLLSTSDYNRPWRSGGVKSINPVTGLWNVSKLYIRDSDSNLRGYHRGIKIFYGNSRMSDGSTSLDGDLVLNVQCPFPGGTGTYEFQPLLFSLRDWEHIE